jgi:hypothetical protein
MKKLPADFSYLPEMYDDAYFPRHLVDKVRDAIRAAVTFIENGDHSKEEVQAALDRMTETINDLQDDFLEADSEIETGARDSIGETVERVLAALEIDIDHEEAIRNRDW